MRMMLIFVAALSLFASACGGAGSSSGTGQSLPTSAIGTAVQELDAQGHRGARGLRPENTLPSFEVALDLGVTTLELDLHFTSDDQVVVWHDPGIDPAKCGLAPGAPDGVSDPDEASTASADLMIRALTADQLGWYQCDRNPDTGRFPDQIPASAALAGSGYGIVTLGELFDFVAIYATSDVKTEEQRAAAVRVRFNIETKRRPDEPETINDGFDGVNAGPFELEVLRVIGEHGLDERVVIQSFDHRSLWAVHSADPSLTLAALSVRPIDLDDVASRGASIWSPGQKAVTPAMIRAAHDAGLLVIPWTVNDPEEMRRLIDLGVDGLITDRPDILASVLASLSAP